MNEDQLLELLNFYKQRIKIGDTRDRALFYVNQLYKREMNGDKLPQNFYKYRDEINNRLDSGEDITTLSKINRLVDYNSFDPNDLPKEEKEKSVKSLKKEPPINGLTFGDITRRNSYISKS